MKMIAPKFAWAAFWTGTKSDATPGDEYGGPLMARVCASAEWDMHPSMFDARPMNAPLVAGTIGALREGHQK